MAAISNHRGDVFQWIIKVIESCTTTAQLRSASNLICLFEAKYRAEMNWQEWVEFHTKIDTLIFTKGSSMWN